MRSVIADADVGALVSLDNAKLWGSGDEPKRWPVLWVIASVIANAELKAPVLIVLTRRLRSGSRSWLETARIVVSDVKGNNLCANPSVW